MIENDGLCTYMDRGGRELVSMHVGSWRMSWRMLIIIIIEDVGFCKVYIIIIIIRYNTFLNVYTVLFL